MSVPGPGKRAAAAAGETLFDDTVCAVEGIRVGIGGWTYAPWRNHFYPAGLVQRRELEYASRHMTAIEINGTYYGAQKPATYAKWRDETPAGFVFSAKAPKRIVTARQLAKTGAQIDDFIGGIANLGDKLGPLVWQFEPGRHIDTEDFTAFLQQLPSALNGHRLRHVLDLRNPQFAEAHLHTLAYRHGFATVYTDSPDYPSFADLGADFVYARLMRSRADIATGYPAEELAQWARRARTWADGGEPDDLPKIDPASSPPRRTRDVFIYFISAAKQHNPAAAMALQALLQR